MDMNPSDTIEFENRVCRVYDVDLERYAEVDEEFFSQLVTMRGWHGKIISRLWHIKPPHPNRNGQKEYFVTRAGWRNGEAEFLHVMVMKLSGIKAPSKRHNLVNHIDGNEWNCRLSNLEWATAVSNRRRSKQKYNKPVEDIEK